MISQARDLTPATQFPSTRYVATAAEDVVSAIGPDSQASLLVSAQASHWFRYPEVWRELARAVAKGGTLAFWGYKDNILVGQPRATEAVLRWAYTVGPMDGRDDGMVGMGAYWEAPGRPRLRDLYRAEEMQPPESDWEDVRWGRYEPEGLGEVGSVAGEGDEASRWRLTKGMKLGEFEAYTRTWSAYSGWRDAFPQRKSRAEGGDGDVVDVMFDEVRDLVQEWKALGERWREAEVECDWGTVLLLARRR